ncbi:sporulation protein [Virgibacillus halodenitrificans]|uniref:sporulation protein n=1 Tax=Virgibacillus halodenitrificans TaxID=1482 RepID=UPI000EF53C8C|nr:sporulation protein [Virgibacillus halodenitrificans]
MSFFNKVLASVGVGSAKVDTKLENGDLVQGEKVRGIIEIRGGNVEQDIETLYLILQTSYIRETDDQKVNQTADIKRFLLSERITVAANDVVEIPFSFILPLDTPISYGKTKIWISTGADIKNSVDPSDRDYIKVKPSLLVTSVVNAMEELGFRMREAICEAAPRRLRGQLPFVQEFEFVPYNGDFYRKLDGVEIVFLSQSENQLELLIEVDRRAKFGSISSILAESMDMDETKARLTLTINDIPNMVDRLYKIINAYS